MSNRFTLEQLEQAHTDREFERSIAIQDGVRKVLAGDVASEYFNYFVDQSIFTGSAEYVKLVYERVNMILGGGN